MASPITLTSAQESFEHHFDAMVPLILSEWPQLIEENLLATEGDLDLAVAYISGETDRTQTLVRRQIKELASLIEGEPPDLGKAARKAARKAAHKVSRNGVLASALEVTGLESAGLEAAGSLGVDKSSIDNLLDDLESRTENLIQELKAEMLPELEKRARSNLGQSLLIALGIGFVLGLILGGKRG